LEEALKTLGYKGKDFFGWKGVVCSILNVGNSDPNAVDGANSKASRGRDWCSKPPNADEGKK
jgi:hypothetical protein